MTCRILLALALTACAATTATAAETPVLAPHATAAGYAITVVRHDLAASDFRPLESLVPASMQAHQQTVERHALPEGDFQPSVSLLAR